MNLQPNVQQKREEIESSDRIYHSNGCHGNIKTTRFKNAMSLTWPNQYVSRIKGWASFCAYFANFQ